ncbi:MAG: plasmid mobilization relaxosome protein MobC [Anaerolineaceae bacterium]|nr:plasmid mobilization relaxosome protein MobC [Anaerolineaceae bacterium]
MSRPRKDADLRKDYRITVRLNEVQYEIIEGYAKQLGVSAAEYVRRQAVHGKVEVRYPIVADLGQIQKLTDEFGAIGNNLNQIAKYFNMGGLHSMAIRQEIQDCVSKLMQLRKSVLDMAGDFYGGTETSVK